MAHLQQTVVDDVDLLYPEMMSNDGLLYLLKQRYIKEEKQDLDALSKEELVELYNKYVLPLPQRKYRNNRRGKEMSKKQLILSKKRHLDIKDDGDQPMNKKQLSNEPLNLDSTRKSSGDRLKPPPHSRLCGQKIIKLDNSKKEHFPLHQDLCTVKQISTVQDSTRKRCLSKDEGNLDTNSSPVKKINKISWP